MVPEKRAMAHSSSEEGPYTRDLPLVHNTAHLKYVFQRSPRQMIVHAVVVVEKAVPDPQNRFRLTAQVRARWSGLCACGTAYKYREE